MGTLFKYKWQIVLGSVLISSSFLLYLVHYQLFHDAHHIWIYLVGDIAFVPIEVLLVSLILHKVLSSREKQMLLKKMNMVIGSYFSDFGNSLLKRFRQVDDNADMLIPVFSNLDEYIGKHYEICKEKLKNYQPAIRFEEKRIIELKNVLIIKRQFVLDLLKNQNLLEHESFTNFLWALFHLTDEFEHRDGFNKIPETDKKHIIGDIERVYKCMLKEWLAYLKHLKEDYPYLFSLVVRTNPFNDDASIVVRK